MTNTTNTSTKSTTPCIIWMHEVVTLAGVQVEQMEQYCGRDRLLRWYGDEMPVWMAADSLRSFVLIGSRNDRAEREVNFLASQLKVRS